MLEKTILILPKVLIEKIDLHRGELDRAQFIDFCIERLLHGEEPKEERRRYVGRGEEPAPPKRVFRAPEEREEFAEMRQTVREPEEMEIYATREDFEEFKHNIKELQKTFIDFFLSYGLDLGTRAPQEEQDRFRQQVRKLLEL